MQNLRGITYADNYWVNADFYNPCPYVDQGVSYPTDLRSRRNHGIQGREDVPKEILRSAGVQKRPASIPPDRWVLPPLAANDAAP